MGSPPARPASGPPLDTDSQPSNAVGDIAALETSASHTPPSPAAGTRSPECDKKPANSWGPLSPDVADRVFPIRSVVNIEPRARPASPAIASTRTNSLAESPVSDDAMSSGPASRRESMAMSRKMSSASYPNISDVSARVVHGSSLAPPDNAYEDRDGAASDALRATTPEPNGGFVTARHKHVETADGHMIVTGFNGSETIQTCEDEPIHIPGAVQGFGCLVALREDESGFEVRIASEVTPTAI